jgi:parallel beta-helix repeat protein
MVVIQSGARFPHCASDRWRNWFFFQLVCGLWLLAIARVSAGNFYAGTSPANVPWPGGLVPYEFTNSLTNTQPVIYLAGLREWELAANVKFVPHTNQSHWILFTYNTNWIDNVSASTNPQIVTIASLSRAQVCHEMGHSFGFTHENIRPDQTNYLTVLTSNVAPGYLSFFQVDPTSVTNGPYDFESVMHLGWNFGSTNPVILATQQPKPPYFPRYQFRMGNYCLSPGDRAALAYLYGPPAVPLTNLVTTTADVGPGSLRAAIYYATDHPGTTIRFNIATNDPGYSNGVFNIHLTGLLPPLVASGTVIDGSTEPGFAGKPLIFVDGSQMIPEAYAPGSATGLLIYSSDNQIKNLSFSGFNWNGLTLLYPDATNNTISGCWFGLDFTGTHAAPNAYQGILIAAGASGNLIGSTNPDGSGRNVLSGNAQYGIFITDSNTTGNVVLGNYIGTDFSGSNALANGLSGILIGNGSSSNTVGSTNPVGRNIISGNTQYGIYLTNTTGNVISGNYLGMNATGIAALANQKSGIALFGGSQNLIGGTGAGAGNVLSGNGEYGIDIGNPVATGNLVQGNLIGLDATGTNGIGNGIGYGGLILEGGATNNTVGGTVPGARNVISGNNPAGVFFNGANTSGNLVEGNYVGTDGTGTNAVPNTLAGIYLPFGTAGNVIGGTVAGARNVISGNGSYGVYLASPATSGNVVEGNYIGISPDGTQVVGSTFAGIIIFAGANSNLIGGAVTGAGNVISGFFGYGVYIDNVGTSGNWIEGNDIGTDATGTNALPNSTGLIIFGGTTNNIIGLKPDGSGSGNQIAFNYGDGVLVGDTNTAGIGIRGNSIFGNGGLGIDLVNGGNNLQSFPVITNAVGYATSTIVSGTLHSLTNAAFLIDVYHNPAANPTEGEFYAGTVNVTTDGSGNASFALTNNTGNYAGQYVTATATSATGDTSEFSAGLLAFNGPAAQFTGPFLLGAGGFAFSLTLQTNFSYHIQAATNLVAPVTWTDLTNFTATHSPFPFTDHSATNFRVRFYRVVSP